MKIGGIVLTVALGVGLVIWALRTPEGESLSEAAPDVAQGLVADERSTVTGGTASEASGTIVAQPEPEQNAEPESASASGDEDPEPEMSEEEKAAAEEERLVEAFDNLTDKWMEPAKDGVTMQDIDTFVRQFKSVPADRKDECLHRALNLVPDENVMLLAGILLDKSLDKEMIELVYNDVLNRDEEVKKPILQEIFKDKEHPCWADTAWILDVTGELPVKKTE
ncbi:MAG: hypothetical protein ACI4TC_01210 [Kiritimatiellia bacterium]